MAALVAGCREKQLRITITTTTTDEVVSEVMTGLYPQINYLQLCSAVVVQAAVNHCTICALGWKLEIVATCTSSFGKFLFAFIVFVKKSCGEIMCFPNM